MALSGKLIPVICSIDSSGFFRSIGFHAGARQIWVETEDPTDEDTEEPEDSSAVLYLGLELEMPLRMYLVGEISTKDSDFHKEEPYSYGLQWRAAGIAMSFAAVQNGNMDDPSFYYGIGTSHAF